MDFRNKRVLITGGTRGIGYALAQLLEGRGAAICTCGRSESHNAEIRGQHPSWTVLTCDVGDPAQRQKLITDCLAIAPLDVLVNNAGIQMPMDFRGDAVNWADIDNEIRVNFDAVVDLSRLALPHLTDRPTAALINISSGLAVVPKRSAPVYCATKSAVRAFTRSLRYQFEHTGVRVVEVLPPQTDTAMTAGRGRNKPSARAIAQEILLRLESDALEIRPGITKWLGPAQRLLPGVVERIIKNT